jgi:ribosomal protein S18 acetylase RimI-like enzyme
MQCHAIPLTAELVSFVDRIYEQNRIALHGSIISIEEWHNAFSDDADPHEVNFIIIADNQPAAWLKLNGLNKEEPSISMLVVDDSFKRCGVGSFAVHFAGEYIKSLGKSSLFIYTTKDNEPAAQCYLKNGYKVAEEINYAVGDGIIRPGFKFKKDFTEP